MKMPKDIIVDHPIICVVIIVIISLVPRWGNEFGVKNFIFSLILLLTTFFIIRWFLTKDEIR